FTVVISDVDNYHVNGQTGDHSLTQAQYESIAIMHDEDNATNIKTKIEVASHEVQEDGSLYTTDIVSTKASQIITLDVKAVTDNITALEFSAGDAKTHTVTMAATEGSATIDIATLLNHQVLGDNDGSEKRWYEISATSADKKLPEGTIITIGGSKGTVGADGTVSINFPDNKEPNPTFTIDFPKQFGQLDLDLDVTITLKVQDRDSDSSVTPDIKTDSVNLKITGDITPVADIATIQVAQAVGFEDAGRDGGNTVEKDGTIDKPEDGIALDIKVSSDDKDGSETFNVTIKDIPNGGALYVYDKSLNSGSGDWVLVDETFTSTSTVIMTESGGKFSVKIVDFQNGSDKAPKFIPPHNDDTDYTLKVSAETKDGTDIAAPVETTIDVIVKNVADAPEGTDLKDNINVNEDNQLNFKSIYTTPGSLASYDDSEVLTVKIELTEGFTIDAGSPYYIENGLYVVKASDITAGNIKLVVPENFSGNASFDLTYITTEKAGEGDSKTWHKDTVSIFVNPIADNVVITTSSTIYEDADADGSENKLNLKPTLTDTGTTHGTETIDSVKILASGIPAGYKLYSDAGMTTEITTTDISGKNYYVLTAEQANSVYAKNTTDHNLNGQTSFDLNVVYTVTDTNTSTNTNSFTHTHTVNVKAVTDAPTLTVGDITQVSGDVTIAGTNVTVNADNSEFNVAVTTSSPDTDGSETVQKIVISGVPTGVSVEGATYYGYSGSKANGIWVITPSGDDATKLDTNDALENIKFKINSGADFENRAMTITTYTKDGADGEVKEASQTINIVKSYTPGTKPGNPAELNLEIKATFPAIDEDVQFNLGSILEVTQITAGDTASQSVITFTDIPKGSTVSGYDYSYEQGGKTHYVVTGNGNVADMNTALSQVLITTPKDMNSGQDGALQGNFTLTADIVTSYNGAFKEGNSVTLNPEAPISPVTDEMTVAVSAENIDEDGTSDLYITLSNPSDGTKTELIGNSLTITVTETWADTLSAGTDGIKGTLVDSSGKYNVVDNGDGTYTITPILPANNFVVDTAITGLQYTPASNRDGSVNFEVTVKNQETGSDVTLDSKGNTNITVSPEIDIVLNTDTVIASGTEDTDSYGIGLANPVKFEIKTDAITDGSESLGNIILDEVPNGFTVWYVDDSDTLVMATNIGKTDGTFDLTPGITDDEVARNKWLVPNDGTMPEIYINAPVNWSGDFDFKATVNVKEENLSSYVSETVSVTGHIDAVADDMTIAPTLTFGDAFSWVDLKLNANMKDVDGSETMSLELIGLGANAQFRVGNDSLESSQAVWDNVNNKWIISGIKYDQINNIQFAHDKSVASVGVTAWTVENNKDGVPLTGDNAYKSAEVTKDFKLDIKDVGGILSLDKDVNLDFSKLEDDFALKGVNEIDLGSANGKNELLNLTLEDVLNLTNDAGNLIIKGDDNDKVSLKNEVGKTWSESTTENIDSKTFNVYSNSGDTSVKVKVQTEISDGITN
ncbi:MAG: hypothetical protein RBS91_08855, partial [Sulfurimonadaceae bacterium]|nr:hypothetical protein [Sulfurimonadaceae bacterium]